MACRAAPSIQVFLTVLFSALSAGSSPSPSSSSSSSSTSSSAPSSSSTSTNSLFVGRHESLRMFRCLNNNTVQLYWTCDGENDCGDNTDETHVDCSRKTCTDKELKCVSNGRCLPLSLKCDGENDCPDNSDEANCPIRRCPQGTFECSERCIGLGWICDGKRDCPNGEDENNCTKPCDGPDSWKCPDKNGKCIEKRFVCDGDEDCEDGGDERNCPPKTCSHNDFTCGDGSCQPMKFVCDQDRDCLDGSDEANCTYEQSMNTCDTNQFMCRDTSCIHKSWVCDGESDCADGTDELEELCMHTCHSGLYRCKDGTCVDDSTQCGLKINCKNEFDELCVSTTKCTGVDCGGGICLPMTVACDGHFDCPDGRDESPAKCGVNECLVNNGGCEHLCTDTPMGHTCGCRPGFQLQGNSTCVDIDECLVPGSCSQICSNTRGSFSCSCLPGYVVDLKNPTRCHVSPASGEPTLFVTMRNFIRKIDLNGHHSNLINETTISTALDYHFSEDLIFWSDMNDKKIYSAALSKGGSNRATLVEKVECEGLAVDWIHNNLYWTDTGLDVIRVARLDGTMGRTLISTDLFEPRAIVVDPSRGWMFWTDWGSDPKVERASLDGSRRSVIASSPVVAWPNGLTLDSETGRVYWVDAKLRAVYSAEGNGRARRLVLKDPNLLHSPFAIAQFEDYIFWTEWDTKAIYSASKFDGSNLTKLSTDRDLVSPMVLQVYHPYRQPVIENKCKNMQCSHLCLPSAKPKEQLGFVCSCPDGLELGPDKTLCLEPPRVTQTNAIPDIILHNGLPGHHRPPPVDPVVIDFPSTPPSSPPGLGNASSDYESFTFEDAFSWMIVFVVILIGSSVFTLVLVGSCYCVYRLYIAGNLKVMNFDNPIYHKSPTQEPLCPDNPLEQPLV